MILLIAKTGIRFSEALGITPKDFDLNRQQLSINKTWNYKGEGAFVSTKNKSSIRKVQLDWQLVIQFSALIKDLPEDKPIFMIKDKLYNSTANGVLARHCSDKGIPVITVHGLRHPYVKHTTITPCIYNSLGESVHQLSRIPFGATSTQYYQYLLHEMLLC